MASLQCNRHCGTSPLTSSCQEKSICLWAGYLLPLRVQVGIQSLTNPHLKKQSLSFYHGGRTAVEEEQSPLSSTTSSCYLWGLEVGGVPQGLQPRAALLCLPPWLCPAAPAIRRGQSCKGPAGWGPPSGQPGLPTQVGKSFEWANSTSSQGKLWRVKGKLLWMKGSLR